MLKYKYILISSFLLVLLASCTSPKNTSSTRWYHSFNTRYNVYFNGDMAYLEALKAQQEQYDENYSEMILMFPVSALPKDKENPGGPFDKAIEKGVKAIKTHSIQTKPERSAGKRNDPQYQEWMSRTEYNPFLHNAWMLMAKAQFHNGDFLQAASSFSYIARLYDTQPEISIDAKIWQARCYAELDWFYEAEDIFSKIKDKLPEKLQNWYSTVYADFLIKQKSYQAAIPYLQTAIQAEKNKLQKNREKYLLGQIYSSLGQRDLAYNAFGEVSGASAPYILEFSAKIRQAEVYAGSDTTKITRQLRNMAKSSKNKDYLDQLYYALGNVYMAIPDTARAIESYELGVEKSVQQGVNKTLNQIRLGDIYFNRRKFIQAQPNYAEALGQLTKEDEAYTRVSKRSEILDELVVYVEEVELQDSLQRLSKMPEEERLKVIDQIIADLKKKEEEERENQERADYLAEQEDLRAQLPAGRSMPPGASTMIAPGQENLFYFYSPQVVKVGKNTFQQRWGRRTLEDDWRRRNKTNPMADPFAEEDLTDAENPEDDGLDIDSLENMSEEEMTELSTDPHDPQFYLQQIPVTEEDIEASNLIIADGLYQMAVIYKDRLEDIGLALETFNLLDNRFPSNDNKLMAYYHTYLIYLKEGNSSMANLYKQKIRAEFPESEYAIAMADPNYEYNLKMMEVVQDSLYEDTYQAYLNGNVNEIRTNYQLVSTKYNQSKLMPKFSFLNALSYVQTNDADKFKELLRDLISKYPDADVSILASEMMKGFQRGLLLSASGDNMLARGSLFNMRFGGIEGELSEEDLALEFSPETNTPYQLLLIYSQGSINDNYLLYTVASFNFGNFIVNDFDLNRTNIGEIGMLQISGFNNFSEITQYIEMIYGPEGYATGLEQAVIVVPISLQNYSILTKGKSLDDYLTFFEENFGENYQNMIERWKLKQAEELETASEDMEETIEKEESDAPDLLPEVEEEVEEEWMEIKEENPIVPEVLDGDTVYVVEKEVVEEYIPKTDTIAVTIIEDAEEIFNQVSDVTEDITGTVDEIMSDPIRGIQNLFKRKKPSNAIDEYAQEQERAEKELQKQLKEEQKAKEKAQRELLKKQAAEEKALLKEKKKREAELKQLKKQEEKAKQEEKKRIQQERKEAREQKEQERKDARKIKEQERKVKEKAREEVRKQKEKERKEAQKIKEQERKVKEKAREEARKQKERERKNRN